MSLDEQLQNLENNGGDGEILEAVKALTTIVEEKLPNGEIKHIRHRLEEATENQRKLCENVENLNDTLLDPEDGLIVKVNKNRSYINSMKKLSWTLLPIIVTTLLGIFIKLAFL